MLDMIEKLQDKGVHPIVLAMGSGGLKRELSRRKIKCYVIPYYTNCEIEGKAPLIEKTDKLIANIMFLSRATEIIKRHNIDLIHTNASNIDFGAMLAIKNHLPHIWHIREMLYEHYRFVYDFPIVTRYLFHKADKIIAISEFVKRGKKLGRKAVVLYNGFNVEKYNIHKERLFDKPVCNILYCGIISESKGLMDIMKAVHCLVDKGCHNFTLSVVGDGDEYWKELKEYIDTYGLQTYVNYYGYQANMRPFREQTDIAIVSSRNEAMGRVTIESMLGEVLVIGADSGATSELIRDGITGYLYEPGNSEQLADRIISAWQNPDTSRKIVVNARKFASENFDSRQYANQVAEIYAECLNRKLVEKK